MSAEANKAAVRRYFEEIVSKGTLSVAEDLFAPDFNANRPVPGMPPGPGRVKWVWCTWRAAFPDWRAEIEALIAEGDRVAARISARGTHRGELLRPTLTRLPPSGKAVQITATVWFHFVDGRIDEIVESADFTALFDELGISRLPALEEASA